MWERLLKLENNTLVKAMVPPGEEAPTDLSDFGLDKALFSLNASDFKLHTEKVAKFIDKAKSTSVDAALGIVIAERLDAQAKVIVTDNDMLATMEITGAFGGGGLEAQTVLSLLSKANITKGINKKALRKILKISQTLAAGEVVTQPFAVGIKPIPGKNTEFVPLIDDVSQRVLAPQVINEQTDQVDMRNLGEVITVDAGDALLRRVPSTKGTPGCTVLGKSIPAIPGKDAMFKVIDGTKLSDDDPNLLVATVSGLPKLKGNSVQIEDALTLAGVNIGTGHVKFKGSVIIDGDVEMGMVIRATGDIAIGGFVESADIQAQGDISIGKGIIGHSDKGTDELSCIIKAKGNITSLYAQYASLYAGGNIKLDMHCMHSEISCAKDLTVLDDDEKKGVISGGHVRCGGRIVCYELGVEGDAATYVQPFSKYNQYKERIAKAKADYKNAQEGTMEAVRAELELKKLPKEERTEEAIAEVQALRESTANELEKHKSFKERCEKDLEARLRMCTIDVKNHVFTHVTIAYGDDSVTTKREHGQSVFIYNQYEIKRHTFIDGELNEDKI
jgi:uncharacterized protein (DUF342 family)